MSLAELLPRRGMDSAPAETQPVSRPAPVAASPVRPAVIGGVVGAVCGIATAIVTVFVWNYLRPPVDLRLDPVAQRVAVVETTLKDLNTTLAPLQTEIAGFYDATGALSSRMDTSDSATAALLDEFEDALARQADILSVGSPVFAVAVAQLRAAALSGQPFEAELLNVYALSSGDPAVGEALRQLVNSSRTGRPSDSVLRQWLAVAASAAGIGIGDRTTAYDYGVSLLANYVGLSGEPAAKEMARSLIAKADRQLVAGDVAAAVETIRGLDRSVAGAFGTWSAAAEARVADDAAIATVVEVVRSTISNKLLWPENAGG
jgi:hypothetical protein